MIYRFDAEWNGEVVAEDRRADLEPFLGLHYPASDIPAQARDLYARNWLRLIPDADLPPVPLRPAANPLTGGPLDLSGAMLRSVSPVHLEYLANMGVIASMSVSLMDHGRLWGLISCHHYGGPHRPSYTDRTAAEFLGPDRVAAPADQGRRRGRGAGGRRRPQPGGAPAALARAAPGPRGHPDRRGADPAGPAARRRRRRVRRRPAAPAGRDPAGRARWSRWSARCATRAPGPPTGCRASSPARTTSRTPRAGVLAAEIGGGRGDFLAWFRPGDAARGHVGRRPVLPQDRDGRARPAAEPPPVVRGVERDRPRDRGTVAAARGRAPPRDLATQLAPARLDRAEEDDRLAGVLQRTLLLEQLPDIPGVALAARYVASAQDVVGGDWYDLVLLPSGRVSVVLGDVAGHGLTAASITAQLRHALRAHLLRDRGPGRGAAGAQRAGHPAAAGGAGHRRDRRAGSADRRDRRRQRRPPAGAARAARRERVRRGRPGPGPGPGRGLAGTRRLASGSRATSGCCWSATGCWNGGAPPSTRGWRR